MKTAKIFRSGNSQAVRIPKEFQLDGDEVEIQKKGNSLVFEPKKRNHGHHLVESLDKFTEDFMSNGRKQLPIQKRKKLFS